MTVPPKTYRLPLWLRRFIFDFVTTLIPSVLVLNFFQPQDALVPALVTSVASAGLASFTRNFDSMKKWLGEYLGVGDA